MKYLWQLRAAIWISLNIQQVLAIFPQVQRPVGPVWTGDDYGIVQLQSWELLPALEAEDAVPCPAISCVYNLHGNYRFKWMIVVENGCCGEVLLGVSLLSEVVIGPRVERIVIGQENRRFIDRHYSIVVAIQPMRHRQWTNQSDPKKKGNGSGQSCSTLRFLVDALDVAQGRRQYTVFKSVMLSTQYMAAFCALGDPMDVSE
ncbi:unnamed protein product [Anisakis simplex]|uniref:Secreted protein n=1 Tax=Anisakis simplex TaxID=6269 RepID=A0A0M3JXT0_ANISI|nr:unnamed protein product [Anisakis simplex]